jgi:digalactosyldiacylglycerol synthase
MSSPSDALVTLSGQVFEKPEELEGYIKGWVTQRVGFAPGDNFNISFYPGRYSPRYGCVFSVGDITQYIPEKDSDVAVLEEPEHLNWFHSGGRWTDKFKHVVVSFFETTGGVVRDCWDQTKR